MKITKEEISPVDVRLTVAIEENDYKDDVTKKLKELGRTHSIPGFRKGSRALRRTQTPFRQTDDKRCHQ